MNISKTKVERESEGSDLATTRKEKSHRYIIILELSTGTCVKGGIEYKEVHYRHNPPESLREDNETR